MARPYGVYPIPGVEGRFEVELPEGVENVTEETLYSPEYSARVRQALESEVPGYRDARATRTPAGYSPLPDLTGSSGVAVAMGDPRVLSRTPRDVAVSRAAPGVQPRSFESLAALAPRDSGERLAMGARSLPQNRAGDSGGPLGMVRQLAMATNGHRPPSGGGVQGEGLTAGQRALKAAYDRRLAANLARVGGMAIGRGEAPIYGALERAAEEPLQAYEMEQAQGQRAAQLAEGQRRAGLEEREMALKERPKPGMTAEEKAFRDRELKADEMRARAAMISAGRPQGPSPAQEFRQAQADERDLQKLGKDTEEMAALAPDMQRLLNAAGQEGDIAGAGVLGSRVPGFMLDEEGIKNRQAAMRVASALLREVSGAAVTPQEAERFMEGRGLGPGATEAQFRAGAKALASELAGRLRAKQAKFRPELVGTLRSRGGFTADQLPGAPVSAPVMGGPVSRVAGQADFDKLPSGAVFIGPDGKRRRKP